MKEPSKQKEKLLERGFEPIQLESIDRHEAGKLLKQSGRFLEKLQLGNSKYRDVIRLDDVHGTK